MGKLFFRLVTTLALIAISVLPLSAFADPADPDTPPTLDHSYILRNLIETADQLYIFQYDIPYASVPAEPIDTTYLFQLYNGATLLGTSLPYPYNTTGYSGNGYNNGIVSFYFPAATAPAWAGSYTLKLAQNPSKFATPLVYSFTVPSSAYSLQTVTAAVQTELGNDILTIATSLGISWDVILKSAQDTGVCLTEKGEDYFRNSIPGLQAMAPGIFYLQSSLVSSAGRTWSTNQSSAYQGRFTGTFMQDGLDGAAEIFHLPTSLFWGLVLVAICVVCIWYSMKKWNQPYPGYIASLILVTCFGFLFMGMAMIFLLVAGCVVLASWQLFFKKA